MSVFQEIPILRIFLPYLAGILTSFIGQSAVCSGRLPWWPVALSFLFLLLSILFYRLAVRHLALNGLFLLFLSASLLSCAYVSTELSRYQDPVLPVDREVIIYGKILEERSTGGRHRCFVLHCRLILDEAGPMYEAGRMDEDSLLAVHTRIRIYLEREGEGAFPQRGAHWIFRGRLRPVPPPESGAEVDYRKILGRKNCWYQIYPEGMGQVVTGKAGTRSKKNRGGRVLAYQDFLGGKGGRERAAALLRAVCMGDRSGLDQETRGLYTSAGAMHLLAISGLHVGLVWWVLQFPAGWLFRLFRKEWLRILPVLALLWGYAALAGFGPSVVRSVAMFSLFSLARSTGRKAFSLQILLLSALLMLAIRPGWLQDVGFQLSYLAMLGILLFFPLLRARIKTRHRLLGWLRDSLLLSFCAQLATSALVIHYFNYFAPWSFLSSLAGIPLLSLIIFLFVLSFPLFILGLCPPFVSGVLLWLGSLMNKLMQLVAALPASLVTECSISGLRLLLLLGALLGLALYLRRRSIYALAFMLAMLGLFILAN